MVHASPVLVFDDLAKPEDWVKPATRSACTVCKTPFSMFKRRNNCRKCGDIMCSECAVKRQAEMPIVGIVALRICKACDKAIYTVPTATTTTAASVSTSHRRPAPCSTHSSSASNSTASPTELPHRRRSSSAYYFDSTSTATSGFSDDTFPLSSDGLWDISNMTAPWLARHTLEHMRTISQKDCHTVSLVRDHVNSRTLVSKRLSPGNVTKRSARSFLQSIDIITHLQHPRIVQLVGVAWTIETDIQALYENMLNGNLRSYLNAGGTGVDPHRHNARKVGIALDIAEALVFLHSQNPPIVHGALQSRKVLLDATYRAKVSGIDAPNTYALPSDANARWWTAPEVLTGSAPTHPSCDLYSFGVILTELDADHVPFSDCIDNNGQRLSDATIELRVSYGDLRPSLQRGCPPEIRHLVRECLAFDPNDRPSALEVLVRLRAFIRSYGIDETTRTQPTPTACSGVDLDLAAMWRDPSVCL